VNATSAAFATPVTAARTLHPEAVDVPRIGATEAFGDQLLELSRLAPSPWDAQLYRLALVGRLAA
jgi:hypothetical protein